MKVKTARAFAKVLRAAAKWHSQADANDLKEYSAFQEAEVVFRKLKLAITETENES